MIRIVTLSILSLFLLSFQLLAQQKKSTLFVGNSYVGVNNLPQTTALVALSVGDTLLTSAYTPGGYTFQLHSTDANCINAINSMKWDIVVLQEQSQRPAFPQSQVEQEVFPYAKILDSLIHLNNTCTNTLFYMTWGRKNGDASNCAFFPPICSYTGMDDLLRQRYEYMADTNHAACAPVGAVWRYIRTHFASVNLYQADESHPSLEGTFAAACTFNTLIFHRDPMLITYNNGITAAKADSIKMAVKAVAYDSLWYWERNQRRPAAMFAEAMNANTVQFQNNSANATDFIWNFGDASPLDTSAQPLHIYMQDGTYQVTLIASACGFSDTLSKQITIATDTTAAGLSSMQKLSIKSFWKNNQCHLIARNNTSNCQIELYSSTGQLLEKSNWNPSRGEWLSQTYPTQQLIYIKVNSQNSSVTLKTLSTE